MLFLTVGVNHIPRPEDWPVMPAEHLKVRKGLARRSRYELQARLQVAFKPIGFFKENPSLHVAGVHDKQSRYAFGESEDKLVAITGHSHDNACC